MRDERIRVEFVRSGGFAGVQLRAVLDTTELTDSEAAELQRLVTTANLEAYENLDAGSEQVTSAPVPGPDSFQYRLIITRGNIPQTFMFTEKTLPDELHPLIDRLLRHARRRRAGPTH
jgi:hypothetical protein